MQTVKMTDRVAIPLLKKLNPMWWLQCGGLNSNFTAPLINNGTPYLPDTKNQLLRNFYWFCRNPAGNFVGFILGLEDKNYTVTGSDQVLLTTGRDGVPPIMGWRWAVLRYYVYYPYISYYNGRVEFYLGWRPHSGGFGFKLVFPKQS